MYKIFLSVGEGGGGLLFERERLSMNLISTRGSGATIQEGCLFEGATIWEDTVCIHSFIPPHWTFPKNLGLGGMGNFPKSWGDGKCSGGRGIFPIQHRNLFILFLKNYSFSPAAGYHDLYIISFTLKVGWNILIYMCDLAVYIHYYMTKF